MYFLSKKITIKIKISKPTQHFPWSRIKMLPSRTITYGSFVTNFNLKLLSTFFGGTIYLTGENFPFLFPLNFERHLASRFPVASRKNVLAKLRCVCEVLTEEKEKLCIRKKV